MKIRVNYDLAKDTIKKAMLKVGLSNEDAELCAQTHVCSSAEGIESHGLNRVPRFLEYVKIGYVDPNGKPQLVGAKGAVERYDGNLGIGITNAIFCADRAAALAKEHGIGCVALKNTTHWMRGGTYSKRMAEAGFIGMNWINTESCMPLWGSDEVGVGNNPFCVGIPTKGDPVVLDMAMSQFSYGKIDVHRLAGEKLPMNGGFNKDGKLTDNPEEILSSQRLLPTGYWKGSSMALVLDMAAAMMSGGKSGVDMDRERRGVCTSCSQVFIAYDPYLFGDEQELNAKVEDRIAAAKSVHTVDNDTVIRIPGDRARTNLERSLADGVAVDDVVWNTICDMA